MNVDEPIQTGIWNLKISSRSYFDRDRDSKTFFYNYFKKKNLLINYEFLVMPESLDSIKNSHINDLFKFWSFDSICVTEANELNDKEVQVCSENATWSSYYSDPKSNLFDDFNYRI